MGSNIFLALLLTSCASAGPGKPDCVVGESRPFSVQAGKHGEVYVERAVREDCGQEERLAWRNFSLPVSEPGWKAGGLMFWQGKIALDLHRRVNGVPMECKTWLYRFKGTTLQFERASTCGP